jgi:DNA-binding transcriptional regulator YbjK
VKLFERADRDPDRRKKSKSATPREFDTSGKSPAYIQHRKIQARAGKPVAGFLDRTF